MSSTLRKFIRTIGISLIILLLVISGGIAFVLHFIVTPERLTPKVLQIANRTMNARLDMESVEVTFFSTFPRFGLKLTNGSLVSKAFRDTTWEKTDSLLAFRKCVLVVNPIDYLREQKITVHRLIIDQASVYAFTDKSGKSNWEIMQSDTASQDTTTTGQVAQGIDIDKLIVRHTQLTFDDRSTRVYGDLQDANLYMQVSLQKGQSAIQLKFDNRNLIFWQDGQLLARRIASQFNTRLLWQRDRKLLTLGQTSLTLNGTQMDVEGTLQGDSLRHAWMMNLRYGLHAPSLEKVLYMIPESIVKQGEVTAKGAVTLNGEVTGWYGKDLLPTVSMNLQIQDASAHYAGLPYGIDRLTADFTGKIDLMKQDTSFLYLKIFRFQGAHTDILAEAKVDRLFEDPDITLHTRSTVDLTSLAQTFPLKEGIICRGKADADLSLRCKWSTLKKQDFGRIKLKGKLNLQQLALVDTLHRFRFTGDASFGFTGDTVLAAQGDIREIELKAPGISSLVKNASADIRSGNPKDTSRIVEMECRLKLNQLKAQYKDSAQLFCRATTTTVKLQPGDKNPNLPKIRLSLEADTFFCRLADRRFGMDRAGFAVTAEKVRDSVWDPKGIIGFRNLKVQTPEIALPIHMQKTSLTVGNRKIALRNATMRIGRSDLTASGAVYNLYEAIKKNTRLRAELEISSNNLNCNQLLKAMTFPTDSLQAEQDTTETDMSLFVIPKNFDFALKARLKRVRYGKMRFDNVAGDIDVRNQAIHLKNLSMNGLGADIKSTLVYRAEEGKQGKLGYVGFDFQMKRVDLAKLVNATPSFDTIMPMLRSFEGTVDFTVTAETQLDSCLNIKIPTLRSAMHLSGDSLVLMDGETFAEISKMLMFKNKKRNVFNHIETNITIQNGNVTIYPFLLEIDRYRAAVGGTQDLDMNFEYHISVLKSPVPFKMGINITGNLDDMKIRLGKAKYKDAVTPVAIRQVDSTRINMGKMIEKDFREIMRESRKGNVVP